MTELPPPPSTPPPPSEPAAGDPPAAARPVRAVESRSLRAGEYPQQVAIRHHALGADLDPEDSAPSPHDYFDAALATCKALTALWYAKRKQIPLERVETRVERDDSQERAGTYRLRVRLELIGPLTDAQRADVYRAAGACPVHKLMTTADVQIETLGP